MQLDNGAHAVALDPRRPLRVALIHPTLGLGGAERLIVDAALALRARGHDVRLYVGQHDPEEAFAETCDGSIDVRLHGAFLPDNLFGRAKVPLAVLRAGYVALCALRERAHDVLITDLVAHTLPLARLLSTAPTLFYCHYPDLLLAPRRHGLYAPYRALIDAVEVRAMGFADRVLVNSRFTGGQVSRAFPKLERAPTVVYPPVVAPAALPAPPSAEGEILLLSLGRYEAKKDIELGLETLAALRERLPRELFCRLRFLHAGSVSASTPGAEQTRAKLEVRARELGLEAQVTLRGAFSEAEKSELLARARLVLYTPQNEHFGIVPLEAMAAGRPVIAVHSGGPRETIVDGVTGYLCEPSGAAFATAALPLIEDVHLAAELGRAGWKRVRRQFSREAFGAALEAEIWAALAASI